MEQSIHESKFVVLICTPAYKHKADLRHGGVGYEGTIISAEFYAREPERRSAFIPLLRKGEWPEAAPTLFLGTYYLDFRGTPYDDASYQELLNTLLETREGPPPVGPVASKHPDTSPWRDSNWLSRAIGQARAVGLIEVDGAPYGTCFLVSPQVIVSSNMV